MLAICSTFSSISLGSGPCAATYGTREGITSEWQMFPGDEVVALDVPPGPVGRPSSESVCPFPLTRPWRQGTRLAPPSGRPWKGRRGRSNRCCGCLPFACFQLCCLLARKTVKGVKTEVAKSHRTLYLSRHVYMLAQLSFFIVIKIIITALARI